MTPAETTINILPVEKRIMKSGLSSITGKISNLQYSLEERTTKSEEFERNARLYAPILSALSGNSGAALAGMNMNSYYPTDRAKLYWNEIEINGKTFKGWLGGAFFTENDEVELITKDNEIIAVHSPLKRIIAFDPIYGNGLSLDFEFKVMKYAFLGLCGFFSLSLVIFFFMAEDFKEFTNLLLYLIPNIIIASLLISFGANRRGFFQALRKQKALLSLGLQKDQDLVQTIYYDNPKFGKVQKMFGTIYSY